MNLKPNKKKVIISILITLSWYLFLYIITSPICFCMFSKNAYDCVDYYYLSPIKGCHCDCWSIEQVIKNYSIAFVIPFVLIYILLSLIEKKK
jgi:hypothetical protein